MNEKLYMLICFHITEYRVFVHEGIFLETKYILQISCANITKYQLTVFNFHLYIDAQTRLILLSLGGIDNMVVTAKTGDLGWGYSTPIVLIRWFLCWSGPDSAKHIKPP